ncbi:peptide-methionine (R)-S-oxide reductase, partial [Rhizobium johnstonii]
VLRQAGTEQPFTSALLHEERKCNFSCAGCDQDLFSSTTKFDSGTFVAGEMLDWEEPTGGYLITACLATGRAAALGIEDWLQRQL